MCNMKKTISILLTVILISCCSVVVSGCNKASTDADATTAVTETAEVTEKPSKQTEAKHVYTAVELAGKSLDEIKAIMGNDYTSELTQFSNAFSSSGAQYIYNHDALPGFAFAMRDDDYYGISIMDGAYLNDKISSDMKFRQIADIVGDMEGMLVGQGNNIACNAAVDGYDVTFCFIADEYIETNYARGKISGSVLRDVNPSLQSIGLRRGSPVKSSDKPTESTAKAPSHSEYESYLGTWKYVSNGSGIPDDPYAMVTSVTFNEINGSTADLRIFKGNTAKVCEIEVTAEIVDGKIDFSYDKDGWENSGHGTITLNKDSVHLYSVVDSYGPNARMGLDCDNDLAR